MTWRDYATPIIANVIQETVGTQRPPYTPEQVKKIRKNLLEAYPFGERQYHPYKIWLSEIRRQLKIKPQNQPAVCTKQLSLCE